MKQIHTTSWIIFLLYIIINLFSASFHWTIQLCVVSIITVICTWIIYDKLPLGKMFLFVCPISILNSTSAISYGFEYAYALCFVPFLLFGVTYFTLRYFSSIRFIVLLAMLLVFTTRVFYLTYETLVQVSYKEKSTHQTGAIKIYFGSVNNPQESINNKNIGLFNSYYFTRGCIRETPLYSSVVYEYINIPPNNYFMYNLFKNIPTSKDVLTINKKETFVNLIKIKSIKQAYQPILLETKLKHTLFD